MSVHKDKNTGNWYYHYVVKDKKTDKNIVYKKRGFKYKKEAEKAEVESRNRDVKEELLFRDIMNKYIDFLECSIDHKNRKKHNMEKYFDYLDYDIKKITKLQLLEWHQRIKNLSISCNVKNKCLQYVKSVYKFAYDYYDIKNISIVLKHIVDNSIKEEMKVWTPEEFNKFISCVDHPIYKAYFNTLYFSGIRRGEAMALYKSDLGNDGYLRINKTLKNNTEGVKAPKTPNSIRKIKLPEKLYEELCKLAIRDGLYLFGDDEPISASCIQRAFVKGIKDASVQRIRIHDLRHSHATVLINAGVNIVAVSKRLGHSDINMTLKVYTHLLQKTDEELMNTLECMM